MSHRCTLAYGGCEQWAFAHCALIGPKMLHSSTFAPTTYVRGNHVLDALPKSAREGIDVVTLRSGWLTRRIGAELTHVDFPIDAILSVVTTFDAGVPIEVRSIGNESFVEIEVALGLATSQRAVFCQLGGTAARMPVERFQTHMMNNDSFAQLMRRNVNATLFCSGQLVACNTRHSVLQRCARLLSTTQDRVGKNELKVTHAVLAAILGVRRAGISNAIAVLQEFGAVTTRRGRTVVQDKTLLNCASCGCYEACKTTFAAAIH
jgi:CRP-like cAMP-binding protein